jgi:transposase
MARGELTDQQWQQLERLLPQEHSGERGHPWNPHRPILNGMLWILRTGAPWRDVPERYGPWQTVYDRFVRWRRDGTWSRLFQTLEAEHDARGDLDWQTCAADSTSLKAHPHAAGAHRTQEAAEPADHALGRSRGGLTTKLHLSVEGHARPLGAVLSAGQRHDSTPLENVLDAVHVPRLGRGRPRQRPKRLILDRGYSYPRCRTLLRRRGIAAMIPERRDQRERRAAKGRRGGRPVYFDPAVYALRSLVERGILRLKQWRRIATRYDKLAVNYHAFVTLAMILIWLR